MKVQKTNDYDQFKFIDLNRDINPGHLSNLIKSIGKRNLLRYIPILVDDKMKVLDGQHRLMAAKKLKVDVYYCVLKDMTMEDVILLNTNSRKWRTEDYLNFYLKQGYREYEALRDFSQKWGFSVIYSMVLLGTSGTDRKSLLWLFKNGEFKVLNLSEAEMLAGYIHKFIPFIEDDGWRRREFVFALRILYRKSPELVEQLLNNLIESKVKMTRVVNVREYLRQFELYLNRRKRPGKSYIKLI